MVFEGPGIECDSAEEFDDEMDKVTQHDDGMDTVTQHDDGMDTVTQHDDGNESNDGSYNETFLENDSVEDDVSTTPDDTMLPEFVGSSTCSVDMTKNNPIDFFELILTDDVLQHSVEQTNLYADQYPRGK